MEVRVKVMVVVPKASPVTTPPGEVTEAVPGTLDDQVPAPEASVKLTDVPRQIGVAPDIAAGRALMVTEEVDAVVDPQALVAVTV